MDLDIAKDSDSRGRDRLTLVGSVDLASREQFLEAGRAALHGGAVSLVLDVAGVTFIDWTGIGALIELTQEADDNGTNVVLKSPTDRFKRLLEITGLPEKWPIEA